MTKKSDLQLIRIRLDLRMKNLENLRVCREYWRKREIEISKEKKVTKAPKA
jgi:hypothetical protein